MLIIFLGAPGAGKGTQADRLALHLNLPHLSTGEMLREAILKGTPAGREAANFIGHGNLAPDKLVVTMVTDQLERFDRGAILDGFPRNLNQAESLGQDLGQRHWQLGCVIQLQVATEELAQRLSSRGRSDDQPETVHTRLKVYEAETEPLIGYYQDRQLLEIIDGHGNPEEVFHRVLAAVERRRADLGEIESTS